MRGEKLMLAALDIIGNEGFKAATVREVCARSGLTQRYYYEKFSNAEDMLVQVYHAQLEVISSTMLEAASSVNAPKEMIRTLLNALFSLIRAKPELGRVVFVEILGVSRRVDEVYREGTQRFVDLNVQLVGPMLGENAPEIDLDIASRAIVGAVVQLVLNWILSDFEQPIEEIVHNLALILEVMGRNLLHIQM